MDFFVVTQYALLLEPASSHLQGLFHICHYQGVFLSLPTLQAPYFLCLIVYLSHFVLQDMLPTEFSLVTPKKEQPFTRPSLVTTQL